MITKLRQAIHLWWLDVHPPFAVCIDCGKKGLLSTKFYSLMPGRITGKPFHGAGTCIECHTREDRG